MSAFEEQLVTCASCGGQKTKQNGAARASSAVRYCSNACRQRAYRRRVKGGTSPETCTNLTQLSSFVGREHDLADIRRTLRGTRLLTIAGPPGAGKSRLAAEIAEREQRVSHRGAVVIDFCAPHMAGLSSSDVVAVLEKAVDQMEPRPPETVARSDEQLLVLENCDRVLTICGPSVVKLLSQMSQLRIMTTSREPWRLSGEVVYRLGGLSLPDPTHGDTVDGCLRSGAVRLFLDRTSAVNRDFTLTDENAADVRKICAALDGLPLALELAAQLLSALPVADVRHRVVTQPSVLSQGWRTADSRHRTWHSALQWSYGSLSADEQRLFRRLSLLDGAFSMAVAETAYNDGPASAGAVPKMLVTLEAKSLVRAVAGVAEQTASFIIPAFSREFGRCQVTSADERDIVLDRLVASLSERAQRFYRGPFPGRDALSVERETLRALLRWLADGPDERQLSLSWALAATEMMEARNTDETLAMIQHTLDVTDPDSPRRPEALEGALMLACWRGRGERALSLAREALRLARPPTDGLPVARTLLLSSLSEEMYGDGRSAWAGLLSALKIVKRYGDHAITAVCRVHLSRRLLRVGRSDAAQGLIEKSLPVLRTSGAPTDLTLALLTAGALALRLGETSQAADYFREVLSCSDRPGAYDAAAGLALCAARTNNFEYALKLIAAIEGKHCASFLLFPTWSKQIANIHNIGTSVVPKARVVAARQSGHGLAWQEDASSAVYATVPSPPDEDVDVLTVREWEVLRLVMEGRTNLQIAHRLYVSVRTVETHIRKIRLVLGLRSRAHMAAWAARHGPRSA